MTYLIFILHLMIKPLTSTIGQIVLLFAPSVIASDHAAENYHTTYRLNPDQTYVKTLGTGEFGEVIAYEHQGLLIARKRIHMQSNRQDYLAVQREIDCLSKLKHGNTLSCLSAFCVLSTGKPSLVFIDMPAMEMSLSTYLHNVREAISPYNGRQVLLLSYQLACGLHFIHSANVIHRDLKPDNILLTDDNTLKISDFGLARGANSAAVSSEYTKYVITRWYRPPEVIIEANYEQAADVWSFGCIVAELIALTPLLSGNSGLEQLLMCAALTSIPQTLFNTIKQQHPDLEYHLSPYVIETRTSTRGLARFVSDYMPLLENSSSLLEVLYHTLIFDPMERSSMKEIITLPLFDGCRHLENENESPYTLTECARYGTLSFLLATLKNINP